MESKDKTINVSNTVNNYYTTLRFRISSILFSFYDRDVASNREQSQAVEMIVSGYSRPAPYLIFGPPGTGKTKTTVEAIKQVKSSQVTYHILYAIMTLLSTVRFSNAFLKAEFWHVPHPIVLQTYCASAY